MKRLNLSIPEDVKEYLKNTAWENRMSVTQYLVNLVRQDMRKKKGAKK